MRALWLILITLGACEGPSPASGPGPAPAPNPSLDVEQQLDQVAQKIKARDVLGAREDLARLDDEIAARRMAAVLGAKVCAMRAETERVGMMIATLDLAAALPWLDRCEQVALENLYPHERIQILALRADARHRAGKPGSPEDEAAAVSIAGRLGKEVQDDDLSALRDLAGQLTANGDPVRGSRLNKQIVEIKRAKLSPR